MSVSDPPVELDRQEETGALMEERALLKGWLDRLEECAGETPPHILDRVREDYRERLRQATERLQPYLDGLRQELEDLRAEREAAQERYTSAVDALEETRLRQRVGEIDAEAGSERETELEEAVREAETESERLAAEVERLAAMLAGIESDLAHTTPEAPAAVEESAEDGADDAGEDAAEEAAAEEPAVAYVTATEEEDSVPASADHQEEDQVIAASGPFFEASEEAAEEEVEDEEMDVDRLPWLELIDARAEEEEDLASDAEHQEFLNWIATEIEPSGAGALPSLGEGEGEGGRDDDLEFLEELDRALAATASTKPAPAGNGVAGESAPASTSAVRYCRACGSDNDARAWYCEICGEELA